MMKTANVWRTVVVVGLLCLPRIFPGSAVGAEDKAVLAQVGQPVTLQNEQLGLVFDRNTGTLTAIENRLTGETYGVQGDEFEVEAVQFHTGFADAKLVGLAVEGKTLTANYQSSDLTIQARYTLRGHFAEKELTLTLRAELRPKEAHCEPADVFRPQPADRRLPLSEVWAKAGEEPCCTFFGRTAKGGFFTGLEIPFDASSVNGNKVVLGFAPSLKMAAGEKLTCEPAYFGVYRRGQHDEAEGGAPLAERVGRDGGDDFGDPGAAAIRTSPAWPAAGIPRWSRPPTRKQSVARRHEIARFPGRVRHRLAFRQPSLGRRDGKDERPGSLTTSTSSARWCASSWNTPKRSASRS